MAPSPARTPRPSAGPMAALSSRSSSLRSAPPPSDLPDPEPFVRNLTSGVLEVFAGVREVDQLARWLTEDAYRSS